jgi:hypothetical protein
MSEAGKRMGFQLKGTSKRQRIVEEKKEEVDMITAIEGKEINSSLAKKTELLVIPLVAPVSSAPAPAPASVAGKTGRAVGSASEGVGLDQQAANELIAELTGRDCDASIQLVIAQPAHKHEASEEGGDGGTGGIGFICPMSTSMRGAMCARRRGGRNLAVSTRSKSGWKV